ncbi:MAG: hypothetical protein ACLFTL_04055, partial [Alphaproteobacteria bacterium]
APGLRAPAPIMPLGERGDAPAGDEPAAAADGVDAGAAAAGDDEGEGEDKGAEIVTLDRFRKR